MDATSESNHPTEQPTEENETECKKSDEKSIILTNSPARASDCRRANADETTTQTLSKRKRKRMLKHQQWLQKKEQKKLEQKLKRKKAKEEGLPVPKSRSSRRKGQKKMDCDEALPVRIVLDMSFEAFMDDTSIKKLLKQVKSCYAANRKASQPVQLYMTSFGGNIQAITEEIYKEYKNWDIHIKNEAYSDVFEKDDIVYLTSDSDNVLEDIDLSKAYIIGGLVDHNHHKGLCHKIAVENHLNHAQLPIKTFVKLQSRTVLTVNHVFEIILKFLETKDWQRAFYDVIPKRKGVSLVDGENEEQTGEKVA